MNVAIEIRRRPEHHGRPFLQEWVDTRKQVYTGKRNCHKKTKDVKVKSLFELKN